MTRIKFGAFIAIVAIMFAIPAQSARRDGLNGSVLIEDHDDVFFFPQKAHSKYNKNRVRLDHSLAGTQATVFSSTGNGAWGLGINQTTVDHSVIDAFYSMDDLGFRLQLQSDGESVDDEGPSALGLGVAIGFAIKNVGDTALHVNHQQTEAADDSTTSDTTIIALFRGYTSNAKKIDLGYAAAVQYDMSSIDPAMGDTQDSSSLAINALVGPVFRLDKSTVAVEARLGYSMSTDADDNGTSQITLPGVNVSFETPLNDWVDFRGGAGYVFQINGTSPDQGDETSNQDGGTTAAMGLSAHWGNLNFDLAIERDFLLNGPFLLTGNQTENFASNAAVTYKW